MRTLTAQPTEVPNARPADFDMAASEGQPDSQVDCDQTIMSKRRPGVTIANAVGWQVQNHDGFVKSYISTMRYGPFSEQCETWRRISQWSSMLRCVILGDSDPVIISDEFTDDVKSILGPAQVNFLICGAGHDLPIDRSAT